MITIHWPFDSQIKVKNFIYKELSNGGVIGPMKEAPFKEWVHVSSIMSREKKASLDIADKTFPDHNSVNASMPKNTVMGRRRQHLLPTVDNHVSELCKMAPGLSLTDISRAYKNCLLLLLVSGFA